MRLIVLILLSVFFISCKQEETQQIKNEFLVYAPTLKDTVYETEYVAEIIASQRVEIRTKIKGFIEKLYIDEGQYVRQGQVLFSLNSRELQKEYQKAEASYKSALAELKSAEVELMNSKVLFDKNIISKPELEIAQAKVDALKAKVEEYLAQKEQVAIQLSFCEIKAPFDGVVNRIPYKVGSLVEESTVLTTLSNSNECYAYFNLSEQEYLAYIKNNEDEEKKTVKLKLVDGSYFPEYGVIETIESEIDLSTSNISFRAKFKNPQAILKHGSNGKVILARKLKNVYLVPQKSTFEIQDKVFIYEVKSDSSLQQVPLEYKFRIPHFYIVNKEQKLPSKILYEGLQLVSNGEKIKFSIIPFEKLLTSQN